MVVANDGSRFPPGDDVLLLGPAALEPPGAFDVRATVVDLNELEVARKRVSKRTTPHRPIGESDPVATPEAGASPGHKSSPGSSPLSVAAPYPANRTQRRSPSSVPRLGRGTRTPAPR